MKKYLVPLTLACLMFVNCVYANNTENLQRKFQGQSMYAEYVENYFAKHNITVPTKNLFKVPETINIYQVVDGDKFTFATSNGMQYYQHDYALGEVDFTSKKFIRFVYTNQRNCIANVDDNMVSLTYPYFEDSERMRVPFKRDTNMYGVSNKVNNDVNIVRDGKVYALDRNKLEGVWKDINTFDMKLHGKQVLCNEMIIPNALNALILQQGNNKQTFIETCLENIDGEDYVCEVYVLENLSEMGDRKPYRIKMYYQNGELKYFSPIIDEGKISIYDESFGFAKVKDPENYAMVRPRLNKVLALENTVNEGIFTLPSGYNLKEALDK